MLYQSKTHIHADFAGQSPKHHLLLQYSILGIYCGLVQLFNLFVSRSQTIREASGKSISSPGMQTMHMGKDAEEKEKKLGISTGCKSCCPKQSQRMNALMKHRAGNLFWGSHSHPILLPKYWLHSIIWGCISRESKVEKLEGFSPSISCCSLLCDFVHFPSLVSCLDLNRSQVAKVPQSVVLEQH